MKATLPDGTLFEGTPEEFLVIRSQPSIGNGHKIALKGNTGSSVWNEKKAREFWNSLDVWHGGGRQKKLLRFLVKNGGRATENEVWTFLGIKKGQELAGVLANITRNARREAKDDDVRAVTWEFDDQNECHYYIPEDLLQFLKQLA